MPASSELTSAAIRLYESERGRELLPLAKRLDMAVIQLHGIMIEDFVWAPTEAPQDATQDEIKKHGVDKETRLEALADIVKKNPTSVDKLLIGQQG